jgi:anti-sigma regulatory factor (Ser/Thr protein kinase)
VPDPTSDENLERLHGRGILLMEAYMDQVQWLAGGRRVRLVRKNRPETAQGRVAV